MRNDFRIINSKKKSGDDFYAIHEVVYNEDGDITHIGLPTFPFGEDVDELTESFALYMGAFLKPIVDITDSQYPTVEDILDEYSHKLRIENGDEEEEEEEE